MIEKLRVWDGKKFHYVPDFNLHFSTRGIIVALNDGGMVFVESNELQQWIGKTDGGGTYMLPRLVGMASPTLPESGGSVEWTAELLIGFKGETRVFDSARLFGTVQFYPNLSDFGEGRGEARDIFYPQIM